MPIKFSCRFLFLKIVDFYVFGRQIALDHTYFVKKFPGGGGMPPDPLATVCVHNVTGSPTPCTHLLFIIFLCNNFFQRYFRKCLSDIYLLYLTEVKQA